ncbi:sigma-70 family RNA polymerase sigma factor [Verrucomicrobia bacterium]|nr:sigma-70 family RNA polymerase sigma factor [Verrucomicrobiota bacterium]
MLKETEKQDGAHLQQEEVTRLILQNRVELTAFITSILRDSHLAEDVFQDVCIKALKQTAPFNDEAHVRRWARRVARNRAIDLIRRKDKQAILLDEEILDLIEQEWPDDNAGQDQDKVSALKTCIEKLTPYSKEIINLRYVEGLGGIEVAEVLNRKVDTIYKALARLHVGLRGCIQKRMKNLAKGEMV